MASNPYIPIEIRTTEVAPNKIGVSWSIDPATSTRPGTYYKLYISTDGVKYSMLKTSHDNYEEFETTGDPFFLKISSVIPSLGESPMCDPIRVLHIPHMTGEMTVAVDPQGRPANLKVDDDGNLVTAINSDKLEVKFPQLDTARRVAFGNVRAEYVNETSSELAISFPRRAFLKHLLVLKESGPCTSFTVALYNKRPCLGQYNIAQYDCAGQRLDIILPDIPFINLDSADSIYVRIIPNAGLDNTFYFYIAGEPARA